MTGDYLFICSVGEAAAVPRGLEGARACLETTCLSAAWKRQVKYHGGWEGVEADWGPFCLLVAWKRQLPYHRGEKGLRDDFELLYYLQPERGSCSTTEDGRGWGLTGVYLFIFRLEEVTAVPQGRVGVEGCLGTICLFTAYRKQLQYHRGKVGLGADWGVVV